MDRPTESWRNYGTIGGPEILGNLIVHSLEGRRIEWAVAVGYNDDDGIASLRLGLDDGRVVEVNNWGFDDQMGRIEVVDEPTRKDA